jgi:HK97 family phage prohead protease
VKDNCDFSGWATRPNRKCSDGRTISVEAFKHMNGMTLPLVWQHQHNGVDNVLGHVMLEDRGDEGTYAYGFFNDTPNGENAKKLVQHGDIQALSIFANQLTEKRKTVYHGNLIEVSLVLAGANPDARIDYIQLQHGDGLDDYDISADEAIIFSGEALEHGVVAELAHKTNQEVFDTLDDDQKALFATLLEQAVGEATLGQSATGQDEPDDETDDNDQGDGEPVVGKTLQHKEGAGATVARNVFDQNRQNGEVIKHSGSMTGSGVDVGQKLSHAQVATLLDTMRKTKSLKEAILVHAGEYGITNIEMLFPDAQMIGDARPKFITRRREWVEPFLNGTNKVPFARIKSRSADLTYDTARAKGYIKGNVKKEQFFEIMERETYPTTIYKKQKLDRDDIIDVTEFDLVAWLWLEMYFMIREEVARAMLVGDGREPDDDDKITETKIRPIAHDDEFYTDVVVIDSNVMPEGWIDAVLRNRNKYRGSSPKAYMTNAVMMDMMLEKDGLGNRKFRDEQELARALRVTEVVEVEVMEGQTRNGGEILMIIVNPGDYSVGTNRGGELTKFDDFDIDLNQYKYLIEGRASGALTEYKTAQVFVRGSGTLVTPLVPSFDSGTGVITIPTVAGVTYRNAFNNAVLASGAQDPIAPGAVYNVKATPNATYYFPHNFDADWQYTRPA